MEPTDLQTCLQTWSKNPNDGYIKKNTSGGYTIEKRGLSLEGIKTFFDKLIHSDQYSLNTIANDASKLKNKDFATLNQLNKKISKHNAVHARINQIASKIPGYTTKSDRIEHVENSREPISKGNIADYLNALESLCEHRDFASFTAAKENQDTLGAFLSKLEQTAKPLKAKASLSMEEQRCFQKCNAVGYAKLTPSEENTINSLIKENIVEKKAIGKDKGKLAFIPDSFRQTPYQNLINALLMQDNQSLDDANLNAAFQEWKKK